MNEKRIYLLDLNYTLVGNQAESKMLRPLSRRLESEEYRKDLIEAIRDSYVIIITARPDDQGAASLVNIQKNPGWHPQEAVCNDRYAEPPVVKESALRRFVFPRHGEAPEQYYGIESNPKTRAMYESYGIFSEPYEKFIQHFKTEDDCNG